MFAEEMLIASAIIAVLETDTFAIVACDFCKQQFLTFLSLQSNKKRTVRHAIIRRHLANVAVAIALLVLTMLA